MPLYQKKVGSSLKSQFFWRKKEPARAFKGHTYQIYIYTSGVLEHKWRASLKTILFLLTSNTEATENKVKFFNLAYRVKGFQCHSNKLSATA